MDSNIFKQLDVIDNGNKSGAEGGDDIDSILQYL